ncbi:hypothetical protein LCGC14_2642730 [marine sediment metagenome]|uniref:Uncharacterized protein n=1 Tax=marine sediment metagenome TaxID=412755 RepID=A0A0F8ZX09_9ZZZZ
MRPHKGHQTLPGYQDRALRVGKAVWKEVIRRQGKMMMETGDYATAHDVLVQVLELKGEGSDSVD